MNGSTDRDNTSAIGVQHLTYEVEALRLLHDVCLEAGRGSLVGLIGPNGAGKSTLLRVMSGILHATEGTVRLDGADMASLSSQEVAADVALVSQIAPYTHGFTSMELVMMGRYPHLGRFQVEGREDGRIAERAMRLTETERYAERTLDTLSGGERQRVFVARALAQQPRFLLLDEPTSNLDVLHQLQAMELVRSLVSDGLTAVAAIHDLNLAAALLRPPRVDEVGAYHRRRDTGRRADTGGVGNGFRRAGSSLPRPGHGRAGGGCDRTGG